MTDIVERAIGLWGHTLPGGDEALEAFRGVYLDPVVVNGTSTPLHVLVDRARMLQEALADLHHELHEVVVTPGRRAVAFTITGRLVAELVTPGGTVPPRAPTSPCSGWTSSTSTTSSGSSRCGPSPTGSRC